MPAFSSAERTASRLFRTGWRLSRSKSAIVDTATVARCAKSCCVHPSNARAAFVWDGDNRIAVG